jgi:alanine racemase
MEADMRVDAALKIMSQYLDKIKVMTTHVELLHCRDFYSPEDYLSYANMFYKATINSQIAVHAAGYAS